MSNVNVMEGICSSVSMISELIILNCQTCIISPSSVKKERTVVSSQFLSTPVVLS